jgi:hypothetical protein
LLQGKKKLLKQENKGELQDFDEGALLTQSLALQVKEYIAKIIQLLLCPAPMLDRYAKENKRLNSVGHIETQVLHQMPQ